MFVLYKDLKVDLGILLPVVTCIRHEQGQIYYLAHVHVKVLGWVCVV